ncbi:MAG TPA: lipase, partial [Dietzia sp.]|nr:lipase [Dietzia sp.]
MRSPSSDRAQAPGPAAVAGALALGLVVALAPALAPGAAPRAAAQGSSDHGSSNTPDHTAFYAPPAELPAELGAVIRSQPMSITPSVPDLVNGGSLPADARRSMYRSTGAAGGPLAGTGTYLQPKVPST